LSFLDLARVDSRCPDANAYLTGLGVRVGHLANNEDVRSLALLLVPRCPHELTPRDTIEAKNGGARRIDLLRVPLLL
jgi:hypothetical protein